MTREEFLAEVTAMFTKYLKAEVVDSMVEQIMLATDRDITTLYEFKLDEIRRSFDWSVLS